LKKNTYNQSIKYIGVAIQMGATIALCNYLGSWADGYFQTNWIESAATFFGIVASMALVITQVIRDSKSQQN
jgi:hypothetical protein